MPLPLTDTRRQPPRWLRERCAWDLKSQGPGGSNSRIEYRDDPDTDVSSNRRSFWLRSSGRWRREKVGWARRRHRRVTPQMTSLARQAKGAAPDHHRLYPLGSTRHLNDKGSTDDR